MPDKITQNEPARAKALDLPTFHQAFHDRTQPLVDGKTSRWHGAGNFEKVTDAAEALDKTSEAIHEHAGKLVEKGILRNKETQLGLGTLKADCRELVKQCDEWSKSFDKDGKRLNAGKTESIEPNDIRDNKLNACIKLKEAAEFELNHLRPELNNLKKLQSAIDGGDQRVATADALHARDAQLLMDIYGAKRPNGGTSDVRLVKGPNEPVAYVFKSCPGESDQMGLIKGSGAIREKLAYEACQHIKEKTGLDFGWPETSIATLTVPGKQPEPGALVEGLKGKCPEIPDPMMGYTAPDTNRSAGEQEREARGESRSRTDALAPVEVQKLMVCNLVMAQYDIKWDNAFVEKSGDRGSTLKEGELKARPFDGGAAFPSRDLLMKFSQGDPRPGEVLLENFDREKIPAAGQPMDVGLQKAILAIDPQEFRKALLDVVDKEVRGVAVEGFARNIKDECIEGINTAVKSLEGIQRIFGENLEQNQQLTLEGFTNQYRDQVYKQELTPAHERQNWVQEKADWYADLQSKHPDFLPKPSDHPQLQDTLTAVEKFGNAKEQDAIQKLHALGGADKLTQLGLADGGVLTARVKLSPSAAVQHIEASNQQHQQQQQKSNSLVH